MNLKPRNVVELAAFVAAIRPGAKSIAPYFFNRELHTYGIPAMDNMLKLEGATGITGESAFVFYDEQILHLAQAAGITPGDAVTLIKSIKKKKKDKVLAYQERFIPGFTKYLIEQENDNEEHARETSQAVWKVIQDSAAYLFNASHALAMAYDSLYGAMLKTIAPYEFYKELLDLYTRKKQKNKVPLAIREMKAYKNIKMTTGRFREDNRDWLINKDMHTISQSLASIKGISPIVAQEMYDIREMQFETFSDFLYYAKCNMKVNSAQLTTLIKLNYFEEFGRTKKLLDIYEKFDELKITKTLKSWRTRLDTLIEFEKECPNAELPIELRASFEFSMTGLVFSTDVNAAGKYLVAELQTKFGCGFDLYNLQTGLYTNNIRERKSEYDMYPFYIGDVITIPKNGYTKRETYLYQNGEKVKSGMFDWWIHGARKV